MVSVMGKRGLFLVWLCLVSILPGMAQTEKLIDYSFRGNSDESGHG